MTDDLPKPRWYRLTPDRLVNGLLVVECLLWLSERFHWFPFNYHKGWTVLIAVATVGAALLFMLLCFLVCLVFRLRFQFSIRSLLVLMVAIAVPFSWLAVEMKNAKKQAQAVRAIEGLWVTHDYDVNESGQIVGGSQKEPIWLLNLLGGDFFADVVGVFSLSMSLLVRMFVPALSPSRMQDWSKSNGCPVSVGCTSRTLK